VYLDRGTLVLVRLYLSSFRLGTAPEHLTRLVGAGGRVGVVVNAIDDELAEVRAAKLDHEFQALQALGLSPVEIDLRDHFGGDSTGLRNQLERLDGLWVRGGNVFTLRVAMRESQADLLIPRLLAEDRLVYAGYSAGPCVLAPSLDGLQTVDDPTGPERAYGLPLLMTGLGVLDYAVVPHIDSGTHPEGNALDELARRYQRYSIPFQPLRDGEALVIDGGAAAIVGTPTTVEDLLYRSERAEPGSNEPASSC
jgi:dipeptidase E